MVLYRLTCSPYLRVKGNYIQFPASFIQLESRQAYLLADLLSNLVQLFLRFFPCGTFEALCTLLGGKRIVHPIIKNLYLYFHPHVIQNLYMYLWNTKEDVLRFVIF